MDGPHVRADGWIRYRLPFAHFFSTENKMDRVASGFPGTGDQHVESCRMTKLKAVLSGKIFYFIKVRTINHQVNIARQRALGWVGSLQVNKHRKAAHEFMGHSAVLKRLGNAMYNANEAEESFFKQSINNLALGSYFRKMISKRAHKDYTLRPVLKRASWRTPQSARRQKLKHCLNSSPFALPTGGSV